MAEAVRDTIIDVRGVSKQFGSQVILDAVDLDVQRGSSTVIIGRSGTGKSVLLKHIVGLLRPDRGEIHYEGKRIDDLTERQLKPVRREVSFVFQLNALFDSMSVAENVAFPMQELGEGKLNRKQIAALADQSLEMVGMQGSQKKRPAELSGGEKKRVALARAIAMDPAPKVILYDEPTSGLDPQRGDVINKLIRKLQDEYHITSVVVTHDMSSAAEVGDRVLMLDGGKFVADGTPQEVLDSPDDRVRRFVAGEAEPEDLQSLG